MTQLELAMRARDDGIRRSAEHAEEIAPGWAESAYRVLCDYARGRGQFTSEDFREHLAAIGFPCDVPKALGGVFRKASLARVIIKVGFEQSKARHCSPTPLWQGTPIARAA